MTNRRSFFKSLALLGAAAAGCPGIFIPKFEPVKWKVRQAINPEWIKAEFEMAFIPSDYAGSWRWIQGETVPTMFAVKPPTNEYSEIIFPPAYVHFFDHK